MLVTLVTFGLLGQGLVAGGFVANPPAPPLVSYVDPRAAQFVSSSTDADPFGVDPRAATLQS
jgi:hypothetical protein